MNLPLHDAQILYTISNPLEDFLEFVIARNDGINDILVRILVTGIKNCKTMDVQDVGVFYLSFGGVDSASLEEYDGFSVLKIGGISDDFALEQIYWEFTFTAEKIFYEEKIIKKDEDDEYLKSYSIGGKNIPNIGEWEKYEP